MTRRAIEKMLKGRNERFVLHNEMENIVGGKITLLGTEMVRARYDGIIPPIIRRLNKMGYPIRLIADGLASEFNHSNNKGRNDLTRNNIVVELSIPHKDHIRTVCAALELPFDSSKNDVSRLIMLDRQHQAIGRNSGYRYEGFQCVVLVDKQMYRAMVDGSRYMIDGDNSVLIDRLQSMSSQDRRTTSEASPIVHEIESLLTNVIPYVSDKRKIKPDIEYIINRIESPIQREKYVIRLLTSLSTISSISINPKTAKPELDGRVEKKFREIVEWILERWVSEERREIVIRKVG